MGRTIKQPAKTSRRGRRTKGTPIPDNERRKLHHLLVKAFSEMIDWEDYNVESVTEWLSEWLQTNANDHYDSNLVDGLHRFRQSLNKDLSLTDSAANIFNNLEWSTFGLSGNSLDEIVLLLIAGLHFFQPATNAHREYFNAKYDVFCSQYKLCASHEPASWKRVFSFLLIVHHNLAPLVSGKGYKVAGEVLASAVLSDGKYHVHSGQNMTRMYALFHLMIEHISGQQPTSRRSKTKLTTSDRAKNLLLQYAKEKLKAQVEQTHEVNGEAGDDDSEDDGVAVPKGDMGDDDIDEALRTGIFASQTN